MAWKGPTIYMCVFADHVYPHSRRGMKHYDGVTLTLFILVVAVVVV